MKKSVLVPFLSLLIVGCVANQPPIVLQSSFNENQAKELLKNGNNKISGNAFMKQSGGGVVTCAGQKVVLIPKTNYAEERMSHIYGSTDRGAVFYKFNNIRTPKFANNEPSFTTFVKETICDSSGNFEFSNLADGDFFITTLITWNVGDPSMSINARQGGHLMQKVNVQNGETKKVIISS